MFKKLKKLFFKDHSKADKGTLLCHLPAFNLMDLNNLFTKLKIIQVETSTVTLLRGVKRKATDPLKMLLIFKNKPKTMVVQKMNLPPKPLNKFVDSK